VEYLTRDEYIEVVKAGIVCFIPLLAKKDDDTISEIARDIVDNFKTPDGVYSVKEVINMYYEHIMETGFYHDS
jgi:hypothetical protein